MAKKRKSIYDKPLKDINKDGKVNFGDTWLGDALGFDGKVGIQKGRPGLKASLKGARRGETETKKEDKPKRSRSRPKMEGSEVGDKSKGPGATRRRPKMEGSEVGDKSKGPGATRRSTGSSVQTTTQQPKPSTTTTGSAVTRIEETSPSRQTPNKPPMSTADARAKVFKDKAAARANAPTETQIQAWLRKQGASFHRVNKTKQAKRAAAIKALTRTGMAAGGMTSNMGRYSKTGNTNYKDKGMFYDSKSPRGYK